MKRTIAGVGLAASLVTVCLAADIAQAKVAPTVSALDESYLKTAIEGDRFEVAGGLQALAKSQNPKVRVLAARLVKDHGKSLKESLALAKRLGIKAPKKPSPSMRWELKIVGTLAGPAYDRWYSDLEVEDHLQDISEASDEADKGSNAKIRKSAREELPILRAHLKLSREALKASPVS